MDTFRAWLRIVVGLAEQTLRLWWRSWPAVTAVVLAGTAGQQLLFLGAAALTQLNAWAALVVFAGSFVWLLASFIVALRILGRRVGLRAVSTEDPLTRILAITLLPFLGIYTAFGDVGAAAHQLHLFAIYQHGFTSSFLDQLNPMVSARRALLIVAIVVLTYLLRRLLDVFFEKAHLAWMGLLAALVEGFFLLVLLLAAGRLINQAQGWLANREAVDWFDRASDGLTWSLSRIGIDLPAVLDWWHTMAAPALADGFLTPVLWLALALLVFGGQSLSLGEVWEHRGVTDIAARRSNRLRRAALEATETMWGDVDEKYIPTVQAVRTVLAQGLLLLGSFVVLFAADQLLDEWVHRGALLAIGGRPMQWWVAIGPAVSAVADALTMPLLLALLTVTVRRVYGGARWRKVTT